MNCPECRRALTKQYKPNIYLCPSCSVTWHIEDVGRSQKKKLGR